MTTEYKPAKTKEEYLSNPNILFYIERSKNANTVVYEAKIVANVLDSKQPVDVYWLDIDPAYIKSNRQSGKMDDRCELNWLDSSMAYGLSTSVTPECKQGEYEMKLVALSKTKKNVFCFINPSTGLPQARTTINDKNSILKRIYVYAVENWIGLPSVKYVQLFGKTMEEPIQDIEEKLNL